jgi:SAM-dependent methyltransferase
VTAPIPATARWATNAHLIADVAALGYLRPTDLVLDPTYGLGNWWARWKPDRLVTSDLRPGAQLRADFRRLPFAAGTFDAVTFDPPFKLNGTPSGAVDARYGVDEPSTWQDRMALIGAGLDECARVLRPGGRLLLKCQDQVVSSHVRWQTIAFTNHATGLGLDLVDRFDLLGGRPQPAGRRQVHARRNSSTLLVFEKETDPMTEDEIIEAVRSAVAEVLKDEDVRAQLDRRTLPAEAPRPELRAEWRTMLTLSHDPDGEPIERRHDTEAEARAVADPIEARGRNRCVVERRLVTAWSAVPAPLPSGHGADDRPDRRE